MMLNVPRFAALAAALTAWVALTACTSKPVASVSVSDAAVAAPSQVLGQNALPSGAVLKAEQSLIMGAGEQWVGRVVADVGRDTDAAYRFFIETYPAQGWTLISSVRGKTSLIVLTKQDRAATVELSEATVVAAGTAVLTISPRNAAVVAPRKP